METMNTCEAQPFDLECQDGIAYLYEYREKFQACKKSWKKGAIFGVLIGIILAFLFSGFRFDATFLVLLPFTAVSGTFVMAAVFGLRETEGFGCSGLTRLALLANDSFQEIFDGTYVSNGFAMFLTVLNVFTWVFGLMLFTFLFPPETLYYFIRSRIEAKEA